MQPFWTVRMTRPVIEATEQRIAKHTLGDRAEGFGAVHSISTSSEGEQNRG
jgi:hypothetical protein